jgi:hypothetical protein
MLVSPCTLIRPASAPLAGYAAEWVPLVGQGGGIAGSRCRRGAADAGTESCSRALHGRYAGGYRDGRVGKLLLISCCFSNDLGKRPVNLPS